MSEGATAATAKYTRLQIRYSRSGGKCRVRRPAMYSSVRKPGFVNSSRSDDHSRPSMCSVSCVKSCHRSWNEGFGWQAFWPQLAQNSPWRPVPQLRHSLGSITTLDIAQVLQELRDGKACHRIRPVG